MKKFNSIKEFINYSPNCLFCNNKMKIVISPHVTKTNKNNMGLLMQKIPGLPLYRGLVEKSPLNVKYLYSSRVEENKLIFNCMEKFYSENQNQYYDVMSINIESSDVELKPEVEVGILNSFVRINFNFVQICDNKNCSGHMYVSTGILAGGKSKKIMPFFLKEECMMGKGSSDDDIIYTLRSSYYSQLSTLEKSAGTHDYNNPFTGLAVTEPPTNLPLVDMSVIKTKTIFENKVENYITFS